MFKTFLIAAFLLFGQKPEGTGIIAGTVVAPASQKISPPVQIILLSARYSDLWNSDVQKRLDVYWERYKPAFAQKKEFFFEVSRMAQKESVDYILTRMRRDPASNIAEYVREASAEGKFEFKNIPFGEYQILAIGKAGDQDVLWQESVDVHSSVPQFLELKKRLP